MIRTKGTIPLNRLPTGLWPAGGPWFGSVPASVAVTGGAQDVEEPPDLGPRAAEALDDLVSVEELRGPEVLEVRALADYEISQVDIAFATGTVLGASRVTWEPAAPPKPGGSTGR